MSQSPTQRPPGKDPLSDEAQEHKPAALSGMVCIWQSSGAGVRAEEGVAGRPQKASNARGPGRRMSPSPPHPSPRSKYEVSLKEMNWGAGGWGVSLPGRVAGPQHWVGIRKTSDGEDVGHRPAGDRDSVGWDRGGLALCPLPQPSAEGREQWGSSLRALQREIGKLGV